MLSIEVVTPPTLNGLSIVSLREMKIHLRITGDDQDEDIVECVLDAAATLHGLDGVLNRSLYPTAFRRYLSSFPACGPIELPYPPLIGVTGFTYRNGDSPAPDVPAASYVVDNTGLVGAIHLLADQSWPTLTASRQAIAIEYTAGYVGAVPRQVKRAVKLLAAHFFENREATIIETRQTLVDRAIAFGAGFLFDQIRIPPYTNWES